MNQRQFSFKAITIFVIFCIFSSNASAAWPAANGTACFSSTSDIESLKEYQFAVKSGEESLQEFIQFARHRVPGRELSEQNISNIEFSSLKDKNNEAKKEVVANRLKQIDAYFLTTRKEGQSYKSYSIENKDLILDFLYSQQKKIKALQWAFNKPSIGAPAVFIGSFLKLISDLPWAAKYFVSITSLLSFALSYLKSHRRINAIKNRDKHIVDFNQQMIDFVESAGPGEYMIISRDIQIFKKDFDDLLDALDMDKSILIKKYLKRSLNLQYINPLLNQITNQLWKTPMFKSPDTEVSIDFVLEKLQDGYPVLRILYREKELPQESA